MVSDHILKIVIEAEDRATAALERSEAIMKRLGLVGTESFSKASGGATKFSESVLKANSPLDTIQKHLKTIGVTGVQSFNQLSVSERKTLLEMSSLSNEAREVMQRLNEVGVNGRNTWNQLSQSQQKALTGMNSLSQSTVKVMDNFSRFGMNATSAATGLGVDINSTKGKILTLGSAAKESISTKFGGAITSAKEKLSSLKGSISNASATMKNLNQSSRTAGSGMGFLRSAASMTVGMIGYDLVNSIMEASRESINARGNFQAFGKRLGMSSSELKSFSQQCDNLQSTFRKVDMNAVGASALELGVKLGVPKTQMGALTQMTAVMSSAFVKEGRTQEDAILAVSDAMDGQFRRLQEIGITQDKLKQNGWNGNLQDTESLMNAINKTMDDMGFTETASGIYSLDDAYQALTVSGGRLIGDILIPITPLITGMTDGLIRFIDSLKNWPDGAKIGLIAIAIGVLAGIIYSSLIPAIATLLADGIPALIAGILGVETTALPLIVTVGAIVAAIVLLVGAIYEIGKAFGWWTDVGSMIEAIQAGLQRLWAAFINNPDVQGFIKSITFEWNNLCNVLKPVTDWLNSVFDGFKQTGSSLDIVRVIIDNLGYAFHYVASIISGIWNNSVGNAIIKLAGLAVGIKVGIKLVRSFVTVLGKLKNFSVSKIKSGFDTIKNTISTTKTKVSDFAQTLKNGGSKFSVSNIKTKLGTLKTALVETGGKAKELGSRLLTAGKNALIAGANAIKSAAMWAVEKGAKVASAIASYAMEAAQWALNLAMNANPIGIVIIAVTALVGILIYLYQNCEPVRNIINELSEIIQNNLVIAFEFLQGCINNTLGFFQWLYDCIVNIPTAAANMITGITTWFSQLPGMVWTWIVSTATKIVVGMAVWVNHARVKAQIFVNAIIGFIKTLPGRVFSFITGTAGRIASGIGSWVTKARQGASNVVGAVVNGISSVPGKVAAEFGKIPEQIKGCLKTAVTNAFHGATALANGVLNALGIHSPGIIQTAIRTEFENTVVGIKEKIKNAKDTASDFGSAILKGFSSNDMSKLEVNPSIDMVDNIPSTTVATTPVLDNSNVASEMNDTNNIIKTGFNNMLLSEQNSMSNMVSNVNSNLGLIQFNEKVSMDNMNKHISTSMNNILDKTKSGLKSTTSTTQTNLSKMQNSTAKTTSAMVKAWNSMKTSIVTAAKKIKTESSTWFNSLSTTIGNFYNKLQHPGGAGPRPAGGGTSVKRTTIGAGSPLKRLNSTVASKKFGIDIEYLGDNTTASNSKGVPVIDLINSIIDKGTGGAGSWSSVVNPNINYIKSKARNWNMKGPVVWGKYPTGLSFKVKEFENKVPNISFSTFKGMAEDVFSNCNYDFYYNSEKYGSWQSAFSHGIMNCSDSSDALIWLAHACGLPATKVHGHWNQFGHYWANIAGHKMDTTGWMQQRNWTPSASHAGPAPKSPFENLENAISDLATDTSTGEDFDIYTGETVSTEVTVNGELKVVHEFKNLPKGVSAEEVAKIVNETTSSDDWQKTLANSVVFQSEDDKVKTRLKRKLTRAKGAR